MLFSKSKSRLGIDIGTSNIKIVQLRPKDNKFILETYGLVNVAYQLGSKESTSSISQTTTLLKNLIKKSNATATSVVASLPNNVVFTSVIDMPRMPEDELRQAIEFEAKKYVPLPLEEIALSWSQIEDRSSRQIVSEGSQSSFAPDNSKTKVLLTAVPTVVIDNYVRVLKDAGLEPEALEIEALALIRSLVGEDPSTVLVIDIGAKNSSINLVDRGYLRLSKNLTVGGDTVTTSIAQSLSVNFARAEQFKKDFGLTSQGQQIPQIMRPILDIIKNEAMQLINLFESRGQQISKILLSGGGAKLPNLAEYFQILGKPVALANPLGKVVYPAELKGIIEPLGLNLAAAIGLAMRREE
ncbi:MAG: type IV pilus assembly protein PilM [Candidatus Doudnabacteria bacterium]|nr:type IV pilus assembly protein PilM [Candidatus Doudnabacteria bacterium]